MKYKIITLLIIILISFTFGCVESSSIQTISMNDFNFDIDDNEDITTTKIYTDDIYLYYEGKIISINYGQDTSLIVFEDGITTNLKLAENFNFKIGSNHIITVTGTYGDLIFNGNKNIIVDVIIIS